MPSNSLNKGSSPDEPALASGERLNTPETPAGFQEYRLNNDIREHLETMWEGLLYLSEREFDAAIVGVADRIGMDAVVVYDTTKIIDILCEHHGMDREEATEYYEFNIAGSYVGNRTPMFIAMIDDLIW